MNTFSDSEEWLDFAEQTSAGTFYRTACSYTYSWRGSKKKKKTLAGLIFHIQVYFQDFEVLSGKKGTKIGNNKNVTKKNS